MIRAIIFAVFVVPVISLVLDKTQKATKKEKFTNTVFVSHAYQTVCHVCSLIMVGIAIALGLFMGFDNTVGHSVVFAIFVLLIEFCAWALKRHMEEVLIDDNMVFDIDNLKGFLNDTSSFGFIAKENNKII